MEVLSIGIDLINIPERLRPLNEDEVTRLAKSIDEIGLRQPISVRLAKSAATEHGEVLERQPFLVAGRHRLEALRKLGRSHAPCIEVSDDDLLAEMWEIAENLHRCDLTKDQRDQHIRRYAELLKLADVKCDKLSYFTEVGAGRGNKGVASKIAEETGLSKRTVNRALNPRSAPECGLSDFAENESRVEQREWAELRGRWNKARLSVRQRLLEETCGKTDPLLD